jgi:hypothetical protein
MGLRFRKSIRIMPGVRLNLGLRGTSLSIGRRGITYSIGANGSRVTLSVPGTGVSYTQAVSHQNAVSVTANALPQRRHYSLAPLVIVAFIFGLIYIASRSAAPPPPASVQRNATAGSDTVGSIGPPPADKVSANETIPIPRPKPKLLGETARAPPQIVPNLRSQND